MRDWQTELKESITSVSELLTALALDPNQLPLSGIATQAFPLRVPRPFLARIQPKMPQDPLLLQVLPTQAEHLSQPGFQLDPLQEHQSAIPGLLHKYPGRVLLIMTGGCAINCRYCFRRHFPYAAHTFSIQQAERILAYIQQDASIYEVILSGGDPLLVKDQSLQTLIQALEKITHLRYLRIHTRLPIMIPARITQSLVTLLSATRLQTSVVIHCNHAQEIDAAVIAALALLHKHNITLFNQSVLLKGINDDADLLAQLSHQLFSAGVLPYYLHLLDPVQGTAGFDVNETKAVAIMQKLQRLLPGYLIPTLVREVAGMPHKTRIL